MNVNTLKLKSPDYPDILRHIPDPPDPIFWLGTRPDGLLGVPKVAVVGSRKASAYGGQITEQLTTQLARAGILIISGLALGIDSIAHQAALKSGGLTLAVLPTSLDKVYPASHRQLAEDILRSGGALISEYEKGSETYPINFIARNRIVSGLADVLLITEAAAASGTMHTARFALEQGKTVMAVPGNITNRGSAGCNNLIKAGAVPVTSAGDIFFALNIKPASKVSRSLFQGSDTEQKIYKMIVDGVADQEELAHLGQLSSAELSSVLTLMEIKGYIKTLGTGNWVAV